MAAEKLFENKVKIFLKEQGAWLIKYWAGSKFTKEGIPDIIACVNGRFVAIETKAPNGKASELQKYNVREINDAEGYAVILYPKDFDLFKELIFAIKLGSLENADWLVDLINKKVKGDKKVAENKTLDNKQFVVESLMKTKREGMDGLVEYMEEIGFFSAPCSGGNHLACEFGLVQHTRNVMELAEKIGVSLLGGAKYNEIQNSVIIAAALHDLGKCGDFGKPNYIPNILKDGEPSATKPFKTNPNLLYVDHEIRSATIAAMFIDLTEDEQFAILYHNGLYGPLRYSLQGKETPLYMIIHWADMWASRVVEGGDE